MTDWRPPDPFPLVPSHLFLPIWPVPAGRGHGRPHLPYMASCTPTIKRRRRRKSRCGLTNRLCSPPCAREGSWPCTTRHGPSQSVSRSLTHSVTHSHSRYTALALFPLFPLCPLCLIYIWEQVGHASNAGYLHRGISPIWPTYLT